MSEIQPALSKFSFYKRAFLKDDAEYQGIFWCRTVSGIPVPDIVPPYDLGPLPDDYYPMNFTSIQWTRESHPHLSFLPKGNIFFGPIFGRLSFPRSDPPVIERNGYWQLEPDLMEQWNRLEIGLQSVFSKLLEGGLFPLTATRQSPSHYGYVRKHRKRSQANWAVINSREGFRELAALCSYAISLRTNWKKYLVNKSKMFIPAWLDDLELGLANGNKLGTFCDISQTAWAHDLPRLADNSPYWFLGAYINGDGSLTVLEPESRYMWLERPSKVEFNEFLQSNRDAPVNYEIYIPDPWPGTDQERGETSQQFFERRDVENHQTQQKETPERRERRLARQKIADTQVVPPDMRSSERPRVYQWRYTDGWYLREWVSSRELGRVWIQYYPDQRRFDPYRNEWDLCEALNPNVIHSEIEGEHYTKEDDTDDAPLITSPTYDALMTEDLNILYGPMKSSQHVPEAELIKDLKARYGFTFSAQHHPLEAGMPSINKIRSILGYNRSLGSLSEGESNQVVAFMSAYLDRADQRMKRPPPPDLWDLHGQNTLHIDKTRTSLTCEHLITTITTDTKTTEVTIWAIRCRGYSPNAPSFTIAVTDPETAVQALRQSSTWGPNESDIIQQLVSQGYPFHTLYPRPRDRKRGEWSTRSSGSLGFRPPDFKPTPTDYAKYEATRERILTPSITRAALKRGGIIWRLTLEIFESLADAVDVILNPSEASLPCWNGLKIKTRSEGEYVDDLLDREAEYIICGVYDVYVRAETNDDTTAEKSWWPKQSAWDSSGLNLGYWTPDCEDWYQHRLSQIRADKAELRSATQWQKSMNQQKKSRQVRQSNRECASKFLEG